jgi:uncharacterized membrane protein YeaQ/YmgE (transglycosylase-associated protein family)
MSTIFDWVTMAIFGAMVVLFLQRSMGPTRASDTILHYFPPALGCAIANYLGNEGQPVPAIALIIAVVGYIIFILKPFERA